MVAVATTLKDAYDISSFQINLVANLYLICFLPGLLLSSYAFYYLGLKYGVVVGATLQGIGAILKWFINFGFWTVLVGQTFCGLAQPFFISLPAFVATYWFNDSERSHAITFGGTANIVGNAIGFIFPTLFVEAENPKNVEVRSQIFLSLLVQWIIGVILTLLAIFTFKDKPEVPPSPNATVKAEGNLLNSYYKLITNIEFIKLTISFTMYHNNMVVLSTLVDILVERYGFNTDHSGYFGTINVVGGIISWILYGLFLKFTERYKTANTSMGVFGILSLVVLFIALEVNHTALVTASYAFIGFASYPCLIVGYSYCSEITFPINEATSGGLFQLPLQYFGLLVTVLLTELINLWKDSNQGVHWSILALCIFTLIGTIAAAIMKPIPKHRKI